MSEKLLSETQPVSFGERLANSHAFADLFRDGMALVEETATYLDGPDRQASKKLERAAALAYATESMRPTATRWPTPWPRPSAPMTAWSCWSPTVRPTGTTTASATSEWRGRRDDSR